MPTRTRLLAVLAVVLGLAVGCAPPQPHLPAPLPFAPIVPEPCPDPGPWPRPVRPVGPRADSDESHVHRGTEAQVDYPNAQWMKNIGSRIDGAGMCVFTSAEHSFRWAGLEEFRGFRDWCAQHYPGGGYPTKLEKLVKAFCKAKGIRIDASGDQWAIVRANGERVELLQYEGGSMALAERALANNLLVCTTLYRSPRYGGGTIYHMTNLAHWGPAQLGAILDNNFRPYEWDSTSGMEPRLKMGGRVWLAVVRHQGPPPPPK